MQTKEDAVHKLAQIHYEVEEGLREVYRIVGPADAETRPEEPIKLLEVNEYTPASGIMPLGFRPRPKIGIAFPSVIVEVTPEEFGRIRSNSLPLPHGWAVGGLIPRAAV